MIRIFYARAKCIGCGYCCDIAPAFWQVDKIDGRCNLSGAIEKQGVFVLEIFKDDTLLINQCADICPSKCISIKN